MKTVVCLENSLGSDLDGTYLSVKTVVCLENSLGSDLDGTYLTVKTVVCLENSLGFGITVKIALQCLSSSADDLDVADQNSKDVSICNNASNCINFNFIQMCCNSNQMANLGSEKSQKFTRLCHCFKFHVSEEVCLLIKSDNFMHFVFAFVKLITQENTIAINLQLSTSLNVQFVTSNLFTQDTLTNIFRDSAINRQNISFYYIELIFLNY